MIPSLSEKDRVGRRLMVYHRTSTREIGLGTYAWEGFIFLDKGTFIRTRNCGWRLSSAPYPHYMQIMELLGPVKTLTGEPNSLLRTDYCLQTGDPLRIEKLRVCGWNYGRYLAGQFLRYGTPLWVLISELPLPEEKAYARLAVSN